MKLLNQKLVIGFDFDGVIVDHIQAKIKKARELGYALKPREAASSYLKNPVPKSDYKIIQEYIYGKATLKAPPARDAAITIRRLAKYYTLVIISRREARFQNFAIKWLKKHNILESIPRRRVFFSSDDKAKNSIAKKNRVFIFIDDNLKVLDTMDDVPHKILFDSFNAVKFAGNSSFKNKWIKIKKWQELPAIISRLKELT